MSQRTLRPPQVVLGVEELARSTAFYQRLPDFVVCDEGPGLRRVIGPGEVPLILRAPGADLGPWVDQPQARPGAWVYLNRSGLPQLATLLRRGNLAVEGPIEPYPGYRHLLVTDPDGYRLAFWESWPIPDAQVIDLYRQGPALLAATLREIDEVELDQPWAPGKWTIRQVVHHIVDSDLATFQVIRQALALPGSLVQTPIWEPDDWMQGLDCRQRQVGPAMALYAAARSWVLEAVEHLPGALDRSVSWPSGYRAQVRDLMRQTGGHSQHHLLQIRQRAQDLEM